MHQNNWSFIHSKLYALCRRQSLLIAILILLLPLSAVANEKLFLLQGSQLYSLDPLSGSLLENREVGDANLIQPTPGGKYIFVINTETGLGEAIDFENLAEAKPLDFSIHAPLQGLSFSPMGHEIYIQSNQGIHTWNHKAGVVSPGETLPYPSIQGKPAFNSRGTRIYLPRQRALEYGLLSNGSILRTITIPKGIENWVTAPGGRFLWGSGPGGLVIVDERRNRVVENFPWKDVSPPIFDGAEHYAWILADSGKALQRLNIRRPQPQIVQEFPFSVQGPAPVEGTQGVWVATNQNLLFIANESEEKRLPLPEESPVKALLTLQLKPNQGFACF